MDKNDEIEIRPYNPSFWRLMSFRCPYCQQMSLLLYFGRLIFYLN